MAKKRKNFIPGDQTAFLPKDLVRSVFFLESLMRAAQNAIDTGDLSALQTLLSQAEGIQTSCAPSAPHPHNQTTKQYRNFFAQVVGAFETSARSDDWVGAMRAALSYYNHGERRGVERDRIGFLVYQLELAVHYYIGDHSDTHDPAPRLRPLTHLMILLQQEFSDDNHQNIPPAFNDVRILVGDIEGALKVIPPETTIKAPHSLSNLFYRYYQAHPPQRHYYPAEPPSA